MNLSLVLHTPAGTCKVCDKPFKEATPEDHYECLKRYDRHPDRYE